MSTKSSESKNIPKNYSKAIFAFIRRNEELRNRVLRKLEIEEKDFLRSLEFYRGGVSSIVQLKELWGGKEPLSKAYRIMSM